MLTADQLAKACNLPRSHAESWHQPIVAGLTLGLCETPRQQALALAAWGHESAGFSVLVESLNYKAEALLKKWPNHFTRETAFRYGRTPEHDADQRNIGRLAYGGRMGNDSQLDGYKHRGYGIIQITGKDNHRDAGEYFGVDFVSNPELIATKQYAALTAGWYWLNRSLARYDDILTVSRIVNIGSAHTSKTPNGMRDRELRFTRAMDVLNKPTGTAQQRAQALLSGN